MFECNANKQQRESIISSRYIESPSAAAIDEQEGELAEEEAMVVPVGLVLIEHPQAK